MTQLRAKGESLLLKRGGLRRDKSDGERIETQLPIEIAAKTGSELVDAGNRQANPRIVDKS